MAGTSHDVADGTLRDGAEHAPSRAVVSDGFHSRGALLPPTWGQPHRGVRTKAFWSPSGHVMIAFGEMGSPLSAEVWTTARGIEQLVGDLQATLVRGRIEQERAEAQAAAFPETPEDIDDADIPF